MKKRVDKNHTELVATIRKSGLATVQSIASVGKGTPDLLIGVELTNRRSSIKGINLLVELKSNRTAVEILQNEVVNFSVNALSRDDVSYEAAWISAWHGQVDIFSDVEEILSLINEARNL